MPSPPSRPFAKTAVPSSSRQTNVATGSSGLSASFAMRGRDLPAHLARNELSKEDEEDLYAAKRRLRERYPYNDHSALPSAVNSDDEEGVQVKQPTDTLVEDDEHRGRGRGRAGVPRQERSSEGRSSRTRSKSTEERRVSGNSARRDSETSRGGIMQKKGALKNAAPSGEDKTRSTAASSEKKVAFASVNQEVEAAPAAKTEEAPGSDEHDEALFEIDEDLDAEDVTPNSSDIAVSSRQVAMTEALGELAMADEDEGGDTGAPPKASTDHIAQSLSQAGSLTAMMASETRQRLPRDDAELQDVAAAPNFDPTSLQFDGREVQYYNPLDGASANSPILLRRRRSTSSQSHQHANNGTGEDASTKSAFAGFHDIAQNHSMIGFRVSVGDAEAVLSGLLAPNAPSHRSLWSRQGRTHRRDMAADSELDAIAEDDDEVAKGKQANETSIGLDADELRSHRTSDDSSQLSRKIAAQNNKPTTASGDVSMLARSVPIQMGPQVGRRSVSSAAPRETTTRYDLEPKTSVPYREKRFTPSLLKAARQGQAGKPVSQASSLGAISDASEQSSSTGLSHKNEADTITPGSVPKTRRSSLASPQASFRYSVPQTATGSVQRGFGATPGGSMQTSAAMQMARLNSQSAIDPIHGSSPLWSRHSPYVKPPPPTSFALRLEPDDKYRPTSLPLAPLCASEVPNGEEEASAEQMGKVLSFMHIVENLKTNKRTGWYHHRIERPESIADHMYRMAALCLLLPGKSLDIGKCVMLSVVHDIAESLVGDLTPLDNVSKEEKHRREHDALLHLVHDQLGSSAGALLIESLWNEYEARETPESRAVKDMDRFELALQAVEYERKYKTTDLQPFFNGCTGDIKHPQIKRWTHALAREREQLWSESAYRYAQTYPQEEIAGAPAAIGPEASSSTTAIQTNSSDASTK